VANIDSIHLGQIIRQGIEQVLQSYHEKILKLEEKIRLSELKSENSMALAVSTPNRTMSTYPYSSFDEAPLTPQTLNNLGNGMSKSKLNPSGDKYSSSNLRVSSGKMPMTKKGSIGAMTPTKKHLAKLHSEVLKEVILQ